MDSTSLPESVSNTAAATSAMTSGPLVLVVDDEPIIASVVERYLNAVGLQNVLTTTDSRQVLPILYSQKPDLVIMDLSMPGISGLDILIAMRHDEELSQIPVVAMTATAGDNVTDKVRHLGVSVLLRKPLESSEVTEAARTALLSDNSSPLA